MSTSEDVMRTSTSPEVPRISCTISYPKITVSITSIRKDTQNTKNTPRIAKPIPIRISFKILLLLKPLTVNPKRINRLFKFGFFRYLPIYNIGTINNINSIKELKIIRYGLILFSLVTIIFISLFAVSQQSTGYNQTGNPVGYEYIDNARVLHIWNTFDDYYFNSTYLWQMSNVYPDYYTKNVLCGWYANPERHEFCVDTTLFTWSIQTDNYTYVNITGYYDFSIGPSQGKIIFTYYLGQNDTNLTIIPTIVSTNKKGFNYDLGFTWYVRDIKINNTYDNNIVHLSDGDGFDLSDNLSETFYDKDSYEIFYYGYGFQKFVGTYWNKSIDHSLTLVSEEGQNNTPITLDINVGTLSPWETKTTTLY